MQEALANEGLSAALSRPVPSGSVRTAERAEVSYAAACFFGGKRP